MQRNARKLMAAIGVAALALVALTGCSGLPIVGSGPVDSETRDVESFTELEVGLGADTVVVLDGGSSVELTGQANLLGHIRTEVVDGELRIGSDRMLLDGDIDVVVHAQSVEAVEVTGAGSLQAAGIDQRDLLVRSTGSATTTLRGTVASLSVESTGSGSVNLSELTAGELDLRQTGSSSIHLAADGPVTAETTGSGAVYLAGTAGRVDLRMTGAGTWSGSELAAEVVEVSASGSSRIEVAASKVLRVDSTGVSDVRYTGDPATVDVTIDGLGSVTPRG